MPFGINEWDWERAKTEAKDIMVQRAHKQRTISYSELAEKITHVKLAAHDQRFFELIGEIARDEDALGHGMLSAIVVHKSGDMQPGPGFFELAKNLGRDTDDVRKCWIDELRKVYADWAKMPETNPQNGNTVCSKK